MALKITLPPETPDPMTVTEVAAVFRVDPKTVCRWDRKWPAGTVIRTLGGHRRFAKAGVQAVLDRGAR